MTFQKKATASKMDSFDTGESAELFEVLPEDSGRRKRNSRLPKMSAPLFLLDYIPILKWLPKYDARKNLLGDITGGLTMGIMHVSEGMAYSSLIVGMKPINGLFASLFPALFYMIFGTSRHISLGAFAVICLMTGSANLRTAPGLIHDRYPANFTDSIDQEKYDEITSAITVEVVTALTMGVGLVQILMGLLRLDALTSFLSDQVIAGFTTGAAVHVMTSQWDKIIGTKLPFRDGVGKMFFVYYDLFVALFSGNFNNATALVSVCVMVTLFILKNFFDPVLKKVLKIKMPIPYDLFAMISGAVISSVFSLHERYEVSIIGPIPSGIPLPSVPNLSLLPTLLSDAIGIAVVILVIQLSMGKLFAKKHNYELDIRQEFYASGITECLCSLFPVYTPSTSLGRSLVGEAAGSKTQLSTLFSTAILLSVIFYIGPLVKVLPVCFLSSIVVISLQGMFMQLRQLPHLWRVNRGDALVFLVAFVATVVGDIVPGLTVGVVFVLGQVIFKTQRAQLEEVLNGAHSEQAVESEKSITIVEDGVLCLRYYSPLIFLNTEEFKRQLKRSIFGKEKRSLSSSKLSQIRSIRVLVLDLVSVPYVDVMGGSVLIETVCEYRRHGVEIRLCCVPAAILKTLEGLPKYADEKIQRNIYSTLPDALS